MFWADKYCISLRVVKETRARSDLVHGANWWEKKERKIRKIRALDSKQLLMFVYGEVSVALADLGSTTVISNLEKI